MSEQDTIRYWTYGAIDHQVQQNLQRLAAAPGVTRVAVMPDVHLSKKICNGVAIATKGTLFPEAVGGDIGCGYLMADVNGSNRLFRNWRKVRTLLKSLDSHVPIIRHSRETTAKELPKELIDLSLGAPSLEKLKSRDARVQLGTLGRGNHFVEFQASPTGSLHILIHSGSRAIGPAILLHHLQAAEVDESSKLRFLRADSPAGQAYLRDMDWARQYAAANRLRMLELVDRAIEDDGLSVEFDSVIDLDHNHVQQEEHRGQPVFVHRKGAQRIHADSTTIVPGSMGTTSFLVTGRSCDESLHSCSHGAGRRMSRSVAAKKISAKDVKSQMHRVHFDEQKTHRLRDEAPAAYKDIRKVMRAQRDLVRIKEEREPVLNYKSG